MKWETQSSNGGAGHHCPPAGDGHAPLNLEALGLSVYSLQENLALMTRHAYMQLQIPDVCTAIFLENMPQPQATNCRTLNKKYCIVLKNTLVRYMGRRCRLSPKNTYELLFFLTSRKYIRCFSHLSSCFVLSSTMNTRELHCIELTQKINTSFSSGFQPGVATV